RRAVEREGRAQAGRARTRGEMTGISTRRYVKASREGNSDFIGCGGNRRRSCVQRRRLVVRDHPRLKELDGSSRKSLGCTLEREISVNVMLGRDRSLETGCELITGVLILPVTEIKESARQVRSRGLQAEQKSQKPFKIKRR